MAVVQLKTNDEFKEFIGKAGLSLVHFYAAWAPQCDQLNVLLEDILSESGGARAAFVDAEAVPEASHSCNITAAPTVVYFKGGKEVTRVNGFQPAELRQKLAEFSTDSVVSTSQSAPAAPKEDLNTRLKRLINAHPLMIFIKGVPQQPRCGFSKQLIALLDSMNVKYGSFDILEDDEVRQGLKTFSNWPTYPQMYLNGELIGGLDVIKEELQDADFVAQLPKKQDLNSRLKTLINSHKLMMFMKGDPKQPKCDLLNGINADYGTFDILEDDTVRQGLKTYSNWPTYPQIYLNGELLGGLDVFREEMQDADFVAQLPKKV